MNIIFMGTPDFAVPTLNKLLESSHSVKAVFTQKPKPKNRGQKILPSPVEVLALENNIQVHTPTSLRTEESFRLINNINADVIIVAAYGFIIPKNILENKKYGCLNLHPSSLPKYRGAAPLQHTILNGEEETDICIMKMDEGLDTGPVLIREKLTLPNRPRLKWLHDECASRGAELMIEALDNIDSITPEIQNAIGVVYANKLKKEDSILNFNKTAKELDQQIRAYEIWPGSYIKTNIGNIKIIDANPIQNEEFFNPGKINLSNEFSIECSKGKLVINTLQLPGKKPISSKDFINGYKTLELYLN